jgi:hypothetical protein
MYFGTKSYLKSNRYYTMKHTLNQLVSNQTKEHVLMQMEFKCIIYIYNVIKMLKYVRRRGPVVWERHEALDTTTAAVTNDYNILHLI